MNSHTLTNYRVTKLLAQYHEHGSIIIGVDFDFTLYDPTTDSIHTDLVDLLLLAQQANCKLCLWTANDTSRIQRILNRCTHHKLVFDHINESPIDLGITTAKPHFNLLLDDVAGLGQAITTLTQFLEELNAN